MRTSKRGFTLGELLVVVAIIGVLVGISIPIFTSQLEKSRQATDMANMRSAKAAALDEWMSEGMPADYSRKYDAAKGIMTDATPEGYGQSTKPANTFFNGNVSGTPNENGVANYLTITIDASGAVSYVWGAGSSLGKWNAITGKTNNGNWYKVQDVGSGGSKEQTYNQVINGTPNSERKEADIEILNAIAASFNGMSESDVQALFSTQKAIDNATGKNGQVLFKYTVDGNYSVRLNPDGATTNTDYFDSMGYNPQVWSNKNNESSSFYIGGGVNNYVDTYLFTSDALISPSNQDKAVKVSFSIVDGKVANTKVWINGLQNDGYVSSVE